MGELAGWRAAPIMRIERVAQELGPEAVPREVAAARGRGFVALKTIAAYRGGLDLDAAPAAVREPFVAALEANEATSAPLPVQVHCGFGDSDLYLPRSDPGHLKPLLERFPETTFVLLHCYPFVREAGWLAHVYGNVFFDLSLSIPHESPQRC
jgi:predicted TIM-barrel fold metal-dependent hydrolase